MELFPIFLKMEGRRCLVVGAGSVAAGKIAGLLRTGAEVCVVAPRAALRVRQWARAGAIRWRKKGFEARDLVGAFLVVAATSSPALQQKIFREAGRRGILCNSVDDPEHCDFFYPAVVRRGALQIAVSTAGHSPALAQRLRKQLERQFGPEYGRWLEAIGRERERLLAKPMPEAHRRRLLHRLASQRTFSAFLRRGAG
jgi:precorrin-2 dehydrogenase / sirohydrochlorin ferrochelatase